MSSSLPIQPTASGSMEMTEREWNKLVNLVLEGSVIPVLGPELLVVPENGELTRLYDMWGSALAAQTQIDRPEGARRWTIYDVANLLSQRENAGRSGITTSTTWCAGAPGPSPTPSRVSPRFRTSRSTSRPPSTT